MMAAAMKYRDVERSLLAHGCRWVQGKGSHVKWFCPCGEHLVPVQRHRSVSPGVVSDVIHKLACLPKGWLQ